MSATATRMPLAEAEEIANELVEAIAGVCFPIEIAGSIRRRLAEVGDIEIVACPVITTQMTGLFNDVEERTNHLDARLQAMLGAGVIQKRETNGHSAWGPKYKRLTFADAPFDLFMPGRERFGLILAIRTGPADFSNALVTHQGSRTRDGRPGMLPARYLVRDGWLTERVSGERVKTPDEERFFALIGQPYLPPEERQ